MRASKQILFASPQLLRKKIWQCKRKMWIKNIDFMTAVATVSMQTKVISSHLCWSVMTADNDFLSFQVPSSLPFFLPSNLPLPRAQAARVNNGYNCFYCHGVASCFPPKNSLGREKGIRNNISFVTCKGDFEVAIPNCILQLMYSWYYSSVINVDHAMTNLSTFELYFKRLVQDVDDLLTLEKAHSDCS